MYGELLKGHLDLLLLSALGRRPAHGYAIILALREESNGTFDLPEGTVYPALHRLEQAGQLASDWQTEGGRRRRVYRVTTAGLTALVERRETWGRFSSGVTAMLGEAT